MVVAARRRRERARNCEVPSGRERAAQRRRQSVFCARSPRPHHRSSLLYAHYLSLSRARRAALSRSGRTSHRAQRTQSPRSAHLHFGRKREVRRCSVLRERIKKKENKWPHVQCVCAKHTKYVKSSRRRSVLANTARGREGAGDGESRRRRKCAASPSGRAGLLLLATSVCNHCSILSFIPAARARVLRNRQRICI